MFPKPGEFVNTWSVDGFVEEAVAPAELGGAPTKLSFLRAPTATTRDRGTRFVWPDQGSKRGCEPGFPPVLPSGW